MRVEKYVKVEGILFDNLPINKKTLDLVFFIMSGGEIPPIKLQFSNNGLKVSDGRHRLAAYRLLEIPEIKAKYYKSLK